MQKKAKKGRADGNRLVLVCEDRLEAELQGKLQDARIMGAGGTQEVRRAQRVLHASSTGGRCCLPLSVVEHVECFRTKLKIEALAHLEVLVHGHVEVPTPWIPEKVASGSALSEARGFGEGRRVKEQWSLYTGI